MLNKWDVQNLQTVKCKDAKYEDKGKLLEFDDGSEWFSPIIGVSGDAVRTEVGVFNKNDIVCVSFLKIPGTQYSGLYRSDQHPLVYRPERSEHERVNAFLAGEFTGKLSRRELMITAQRLCEVCKERDINEDWIIDKLISEADNARNKGFERIEAIKVLARIAGREIGMPVVVQNQGPQPLFGNVNILTVQDQRRAQRELQYTLGKAVTLAKDQYEISESSVEEEPERELIVEPE